MRIALVILHADPARGGAERYTVDLADALRSRGQDVALISSTFAPGDPPAGAVDFGGGSGTRVGRYIRFLGRLDQHLLDNRYDIVHAMLPVRNCDVYHPHAGIAAEALFGARARDQGPVMRVIAMASNRLNLRRQRFAAVELELLTGPRPPVVLCLSNYLKAGLKRYYSLPESRLATLFNATDLKRFDPAARPQVGIELRGSLAIAPDRVVALMIAQDFSRKGLAEAIVALSHMADPRLILLVVGKQDPTAFRKLADEKNVGARVIFAGETSDPYSFYQASDFFVLPTRHDPCSLVVLEALAMGLPVISTVFNGACEIMQNAAHGFILPDPADVSALADAYRTLLDNATRKSMSQNCLALRPRLAYEKHIEELLGIYNQTIAGKTNDRAI
ncbi:MAG TPA: glycosyltransferase family 4 protein [Tepidisphaeraceae bacterium]|nr:glycosyltransferase family 4 protein [Tepidisphaeraceae bacterium]